MTTEKLHLSDSKERVALDLLKIIADHGAGEKAEKRDRDYFLTLYHQCLAATNHAALDRLLKIGKD